MSDYYDRQGKPMEMMDWAKRLETDRRVAVTTLPDGHWVSTVWLGLDHSFTPGGPPLIFETMVFPPKGEGMGDLDCDRYSTEAEALAGHERMVEKWTQELQQAVDAVGEARG